MNSDRLSPAASSRLASRSFRLRASAWMLSPLLLFGYGTGLSFFYIGSRAKRPLWAVWGVAYLFAVLLATALPFLLVLVWLGGAFHAYKVNEQWLRFRAQEEGGTAGGVAPIGPSNVWSGPAPATSGHTGLAGLGVQPEAFYDTSVPRQAPAPAPAAAPPRSAPSPSPALDEGSPVDITTAAPERLAELPGMTPARVSAVLAARAAHVRIRSLDDLGDVAGLQPHERLRLQDRVRFSAPTSADGIGRDGRLLDI